MDEIARVSPPLRNMSCNEKFRCALQECNLVFYFSQRCEIRCSILQLASPRCRLSSVALQVAGEIASCNSALVVAAISRRFDCDIGATRTSARLKALYIQLSRENQNIAQRTKLKVSTNCLELCMSQFHLTHRSLLAELNLPGHPTRKFKRNTSSVFFTCRRKFEVIFRQRNLY